MAWGSGLNERVQTNLKAMDMLLEELDIISCTPHIDLLSPRVSVPSTMEVYVAAEPEIIEVKWEGGIHDWGCRGIISLESPENRPCVAFLEIVQHLIPEPESQLK